MLPLIGLAGVARAGKDSMFEALNEIKPGAIRLSIGDIIREDCEPLIHTKLNIDMRGGPISPENKEIIRPLLVGYGLMMRKASKGQYFINRLNRIMHEYEQIANLGAYFVITDVRFDEYENDEVDWIQKRGGAVIHLTRDLRGPMDILANAPADYVKPNNPSEAENDPKIKKKANHCHVWASQSNTFHRCQHAQRVLEAIEPLKLFQ